MDAIRAGSLAANASAWDLVFFLEKDDVLFQDVDATFGKIKTLDICCLDLLDCVIGLGFACRDCCNESRHNFVI